MVQMNHISSYQHKKVVRKLLFSKKKIDNNQINTTTRTTTRFL